MTDIIAPPAAPSDLPAARPYGGHVASGLLIDQWLSDLEDVVPWVPEYDTARPAWHAVVEQVYALTGSVGGLVRDLENAVADMMIAYRLQGWRVAAAVHAAGVELDADLSPYESNGVSDLARGPVAGAAAGAARGDCDCDWWQLNCNAENVAEVHQLLLDVEDGGLPARFALMDHLADEAADEVTGAALPAHDIVDIFGQHRWRDPKLMQRFAMMLEDNDRAERAQANLQHLKHAHVTAQVALDGVRAIIDEPYTRREVVTEG